MPQHQWLLDTFLPEHFGLPIYNVEYTLIQRVKEVHRGMQHIVIVDTHFPLPAYLQFQNIEVTLNDRHKLHRFDPAQHKLVGTVQTGQSEFKWGGTEFIVYKFTWPEPTRGMYIMYVIVFQASSQDDAGKDKVGEDLITAAYEWSLATKNLNEEIWMYSNGGWTKDKKLWKAIQLAGWNNLVLDQEFVTGLKRDTDTFFSSQEIYESLEIPWKRGILLLGPPGNGKTESIKVLLKESKIPALYVKSFFTVQGSEGGIRAIFEFARGQAPCFLVLEYLDSMVTPANIFLEREKNDGILTIATSNHPERIDDSILTRPSRFDVKYTFDLPTYDLRKAYIDKWLVKTRKISGIDFKNEKFVREMAEQTEGFSFAFMKELFVSFLLRTAHDKATGKAAGEPESVMQGQIEQLVLQLDIGKNTKSKEDDRGSRVRGPRQIILPRDRDADIRTTRSGW